MPAPRSATLVTTKSPCCFGGDRDGLVGRRILIGILDQVDERLAGARQVHANERQIWQGRASRCGDSRERSCVCKSAASMTSVERTRLEFQLHFAGVEPRHFCRLRRPGGSSGRFLR